MNVVELCSPDPAQIISKIFLRPKPDGSYRKILNLRYLNNFLPVEHFKMEGLDVALDLVTRNCCFASVDLEKAYYSVLIDPSF